MDPNTAHILHDELLYHLPVRWWWLFHHKEELNLGLAKAFGRPRAEIVDALLLNTGIRKDRGNSFALTKKKWDSFCGISSAQIQFQTCDKRIYVVNGVGEYHTPGEQIKSKDPVFQWCSTNWQSVRIYQKVGRIL